MLFVNKTKAVENMLDVVKDGSEEKVNIGLGLNIDIDSSDDFIDFLESIRNIEVSLESLVNVVLLFSE